MSSLPILSALYPSSVYFLDTTGTACPNGVGLPSSSATLPTTPLAYNIKTLQPQGLPSNLCIVAGFPQIPNKEATVTAYPFGIWFANAASAETVIKALTPINWIW